MNRTLVETAISYSLIWDEGRVDIRVDDSIFQVQFKQQYRQGDEDSGIPGAARASNAELRYDRVKARLDNFLRESAYAKNEGDVPNGWKIECDKIIAWEQRDAFGRRGFDWEDVPSTLIDEEASGGHIDLDSTPFWACNISGVKRLTFLAQLEDCSGDKLEYLMGVQRSV